MDVIARERFRRNNTRYVAGCYCTVGGEGGFYIWDAQKYCWAYAFGPSDPADWFTRWPTADEKQQGQQYREENRRGGEAGTSSGGAGEQ